MKKTCKQCSREFEITDDDLAFFRKITPSFAGKAFEIPPPQACPKCRMREKLAFRNENKFYKIKSKLSSKELISPYSPDCRYTIYSSSEWYSDDWNPLDFGAEFDFTKSFFEQFKELAHKVPIPHAAISNNEDSEYISNASNNKSCYLISNSGSNENCMYGVTIWDSRDCMDCYRIFNCENCYEVLSGYDSMSCYWSKDIENCSDSYFLRDCIGCKNCFACTNLNSKQYWAYNKESTKEEVERIINDFNNLETSERQLKEKEISDYIESQSSKKNHIKSSENATGDYINHSKNITNCFFVDDSEGANNCSNLNKGRDVYETSFNGPPIEGSYHTVTCGLNSYGLISCYMVFNNVSNIFYSISCLDNCKDCFGCVGLRQKQYCIFNKQYTKEEYEQKVGEIIEKMKADGEWGEFFPLSFSPFGYNDTLAGVFFPLNRSEAEKIGANWQDDNYEKVFDGLFYQPKIISGYDPSKSPNAKDNINDLMNSVMQCQITKRLYKILSKELHFYIKNQIPLPSKHPEQRQKERFEKFNLYKDV